MYLPSDTPLLTQQREDAARNLACDAAQVADTRRLSAQGRIDLFNTLVKPNTVAQTFGMGTALDTAKLQAQTRESRGSGIFGSGERSGSGPTAAEIIAGAPEVVSLNRGSGCGDYSPVPLDPNPVPGMPNRAPTIVDGPYGPMYYRGADATYPNEYPTRTGLTGYAPPWSDASVSETPLNIGGNDMGVASWLMDNPWLALAIGAAGVAFFSRRAR